MASGDHVVRLRAMYDAWWRRDRSAWLAHMAPDVSFEVTLDDPPLAFRPGRESAGRYWDESFDRYERIDPTGYEWIEAGDLGVVIASAHFLARDSHVAGTRSYVQAMRFRDDLVSWWGVWPTWEEAVEGLGSPVELEAVDLARRSFDALSRRDAAELVELLDPDVVLEPLPAGTVLRGHAEVRDWIEDGLPHIWEELAVLPFEYRADGRLVLVLGHVRGRSAGCASLREELGWIGESRAGLVTSARAHLKVPEAIAAFEAERAARVGR